MTRKGSCRLDSLQTQRLLAGMSIQELARRSLTSDHIITCLEQRPVGGDCTHEEAARIAAALGVSLVTLGQAIY